MLALPDGIPRMEVSLRGAKRRSNLGLFNRIKRGNPVLFFFLILYMYFYYLLFDF